MVSKMEIIAEQLIGGQRLMAGLGSIVGRRLQLIVLGLVRSIIVERQLMAGLGSIVGRRSQLIIGLRSIIGHGDVACWTAMAIDHWIDGKRSLDCEGN